MCSQPTLWDIPNAISSQESASGVTPSDSQDGRTIGLSGPVAARAGHSALLGSEKHLPTSAICGRNGGGLFGNADPPSYLGSRLRRP